jgi:hypothetical protein
MQFRNRGPMIGAPAPSKTGYQGEKLGTVDPCKPIADSSASDRRSFDSNAINHLDRKDQAV